jgi:hypothetical protein
MAVVSISRIQIRRGRKNEGSGLPQLAGGELAWAVDTQEMFIGNGSVAEGAPFVGNTKLLTEKDNILAFAKSYEYKSTNDSIQTGPGLTPIQRSLQDRLDDIVSITSFNALGDGSDQTDQIQRAITQLYMNPNDPLNNSNRVILQMLPGNYVVSRTIVLPSFVNIIGSGIDNTVLTKTTPGPVFRTVSDVDIPLINQLNATDLAAYVNSSAITETNQSRNIHISDMTIDVAGSAGFLLNSVRDSEFRNIKIKGTWTNGSTLDNTNYGIKMTMVTTGGVGKNNTFQNIKFEGLSVGVYSDNDIEDNRLSECSFETHYNGIAFGTNQLLGATAATTGPRSTKVNNCRFKNIDRQAIYIKYGAYNISQSNSFIDVGYQWTAGVIQKNNPQWPIIEFGDTAYNNGSDNDYFNRTEQLSSDPNYLSNVAYIPEIQGPGFDTVRYLNRKNLTQSTSPSVFFKIPADNTKSIEIEYTYKSNTVNAFRKGVITVVSNPAGDLRSVSDEYDYVGDSLYEENLVFGSESFDENLDGVVDSLGITVLNLTINDQSEFHYRLKTAR